MGDPTQHELIHDDLADVVRRCTIGVEDSHILFNRIREMQHRIAELQKAFDHATDAVIVVGKQRDRLRAALESCPDLRDIQNVASQFLAWYEGPRAEALNHD